MKNLKIVKSILLIHLDINLLGKIWYLKASQKKLQEYRIKFISNIKVYLLILKLLYNIQLLYVDNMISDLNLQMLKYRK